MAEGCVAVWYCAVLLRVCGARFAFTFTWKVTLAEAPAGTDGMIAVTVAPAPSVERKSMPGGNAPACSTPSLASVRAVPPVMLARPEPATPRLRQAYEEAGGLSGRPLQARSTEVIRHLHKQSRGTVPIIGVGGIFNAADAWEKIAAGASLIQVYTGLVYEGPAAVKEIVSGLGARLRGAGLTELARAVGRASS